MKQKIITECLAFGVGAALAVAGNCMVPRGWKVTGVVVTGIGCVIMNHAVIEVAFAGPQAWASR